MITLNKMKETAIQFQQNFNMHKANYFISLLDKDETQALTPHALAKHPDWQIAKQSLLHLIKKLANTGNFLKQGIQNHRNTFIL